MTKRKDLVVVALATFCLTASLFMISSIKSAGIGEYDPWADINNDGIVDIYDAILLSNAYNVHGQNATKSSVMYDSGWVNVTDKAGQNIVFSHGLGMLDWNNENIMVEIIGRTVPGGELLRHLGLQEVQVVNKTYGGTNDDAGWDLVQTSDGGYALTGRTSSFGAGSWDFWLVKTDANGNAQWNKTYGGTGYEWAWGLVQTSDGGYALAGYTDSFGAGWDDFWLVKTDANGNMEWNKTYGGTNNDDAYGLVQTSDGGYALTGGTYSYGVGNVDFWLVKTDANGNAQWNKTYGGTGDEWAWHLVQTTDGGYALTGGTWSFGAGNCDFWLVKTDANGNMEWNKTYGGTGADYAPSLVQTSDNGYALAGWTNSFGAGGNDFWLVKTDANGNMEWNKTYGGTNNDASASVQALDGGYALAGPTTSFGAGGYDFWLVKTDANGNMEWNKTYGGTGAEGAQALVYTSDGGYALAGYTDSFGAGGADFWLVKTDADGNLVSREFGLVWVDSPADTVTLYRGQYDDRWNYVRVRILKAK